MRLIDADKIDFEKVFIGASDFAKDTREAAQKLIDEQPIAYDVDKVVKKFEECAIIELGITKEKFEMDRGEYSSYCTLSLTETKEIIKSGGIE